MGSAEDEERRKRKVVYVGNSKEVKTIKLLCFWNGVVEKEKKTQAARRIVKPVFEAAQSHDIPGLEQLDRELLDRHGAPAARAPFSSCNDKRRTMRSEDEGGSWG